MSKQHAPATQRNREPIRDVLRQELPESGGVLLEIAAGTGEHAVYLSKAFPTWQWQPTDPHPEALKSIAAWRAEEGGANLLPPLQLDASADDWPVEHADAVLCINMVHISEWDATTGLFRACSGCLSKGAPIVLYGPYFEDAVQAAPSNLAFDRSLKERNPAWGLRNVSEVDRVASECGFRRTNRYEMPANNLMLVYRRNLASPR